MKTEQTERPCGCWGLGPGKLDREAEASAAGPRGREPGPHSRCPGESVHVFAWNGALPGGGSRAFSSHLEHTTLVTSTRPS